MAQNRPPKNDAPDRTEAGPDIAPNETGAQMQAHRDRRKDEPSAAAMATDAESGGAAAETPAERAHSDPARPIPDADRARARHEVRAGPGDAGAQDAPEVLPKTPRTQKANWARIGLWFAVPLAIILAIYWAYAV